MRCEFCQGRGFLRSWPTIINDVTTWHWHPCIECHGVGIVSCCEGSARHGQLPSCTGDGLDRHADDPG